MALFIIFLVLVFLLYIPYTRCILFHPFSFIFYFVKDLFIYIKYKKWRECHDFGKIICATALFGGGKTLTSVHYAIRIFKKYNGKSVYNPKTKLWVPQRVYIHSNVKLNIPYVPLISTQDIIDVSKDFSDWNFMDIHIFLIDEASTQFNSRQFKRNFDNPNLLNTILTCRHVKIGIILTSQRFLHMDALMRQVTSTVRECAHIWRLYKLSYYDAWNLENTTNINLVQPLYTRTLFIRDKDYRAYDTYAIVDNLIKSNDAGDMLSADEILERRSFNSNDDNSVVYKKRVRKKCK